MDGKVPAAIPGGAAAVCRLFADAAASLRGTVVIIFHPPDTVSAKLVSGRGPHRRSRHASVAVSDREVGPDSIAVLAHAVAKSRQ